MTLQELKNTIPGRILEISEYYSGSTTSLSIAQLNDNFIDFIKTHVSDETDYQELYESFQSQISIIIQYLNIVFAKIERNKIPVKNLIIGSNVSAMIKKLASDYFNIKGGKITALWTANIIESELVNPNDVFGFGFPKYIGNVHLKEDGTVSMEFTNFAGISRVRIKESMLVKQGDKNEL